MHTIVLRTDNLKGRLRLKSVLPNGRGTEKKKKTVAELH